LLGKEGSIQKEIIAYNVCSITVQLRETKALGSESSFYFLKLTQIASLQSHKNVSFIIKVLVVQRPNVMFKWFFTNLRIVFCIYLVCKQWSWLDRSVFAQHLAGETQTFCQPDNI
jgi:hypothetical protein